VGIISKPIVFTGASTMFLLVYLALWNYHNNNPLFAALQAYSVKI
jgi:hypothetical protein